MPTDDDNTQDATTIEGLKQQISKLRGDRRELRARKVGAAWAYPGEEDAGEIEAPDWLPD